MTFHDILGHDRPVAILKRALAQGTLAHAYLFSGEAGIGKKMTALALAAALHCGDLRENSGCGVCPSCRAAATLNHPDVHVVTGDGGEIKIDQIRQVQADLALKPFQGEKKVLIVDGAEDMNPASANAFLKTLEEPPGDTLIVLISSMPQGLLPTIRSRCQEIRFHPLSRRTLAQALVLRRGLSEADAWFVAALAQGSMGRGLEMDVEQEKAEREEFLGLWSRLGDMGADEALAHADAFAKDRERFERLLDRGVQWLRDAVVFHETGDEKLLVYAHGGDALKERYTGVSLERMLLDMELFSESRSLLDRRVSAQLVADNLFLKLGRG